MKQIFTLLLLSLVIISCKKDDDNGLPPIEQLPLETQIGAGTFGCLIDGEPFIDNDGNYNCFYQLVDGEYYFSIKGEKRSDYISSVTLGTIRKEMLEDSIFILKEHEDGNAAAALFFPELLENAQTSENFQGEFHVTKFDEVNRIVSGTFWFDAPHPTTGVTIKVRNGRFDTFYGQ